MPRVVGMARTVSAPMRTAALQEPMCCPVSSETKACSTPPRPTSTASDSLPDTPRCPSVPSSNGTIPSYDAHDFRNKRQRHVVEDVRRSPHPPPASPRQSPLRFIAVAEHHPGTTIASPRIASPLTEQLDGRARPLGDVHLEQMLEDQEENGVVTHSAGYKLHLADNQTGYKGVSRSTRGRPTFCAQKYFKGKNITIGTFATKARTKPAQPSPPVHVSTEHTMAGSIRSTSR
ncbi:hypothetical protein AB1Y20_011229 [Prymnesium parvum]|uniref:Uncharacterized protein n=1 Tax=Prymnesium parvum TaxID=97485 RepID=A0AB34IPU9_PRYPA